MSSAEALLLDTHALLWWQAESGRLSTTARERIAAARQLLISPISCWEVAMLVDKGRARLDRPTAAWVRDLLADVDLAELTAGIAVAAAELSDFHGDPADRFLYATARAQGSALVTQDRALHAYAEADRAVSVVW